ncbi:MAG: cobalamin biosynthesis protein CbiG [Tissierellia bacterium]|nr:cobalamin biosynthesis protein CbiG [Tissierellia bacterium]
MRIAAIAFSACGAVLMDRLMALTTQGHEVDGYITVRHAEGTAFEPFDSVYEITSRLFHRTDALLFIGACGIAVRSIAPLIKSKLSDPAVVVCDETGRFAISLLSGHAGGANGLTEQVAGLIGAVPVITTASDSHAILGDAQQPRNLVLGIGCRRGTPAETIERAATILLWDQQIPLARVCEVATIDVKRNEEGLLGFTKAHKLPLRFYSAEELKKVDGEFMSSEMVLKTVGVDNVCERAATLCGGTGKLILRKTAKDGVTVAVFEREINHE